MNAEERLLLRNSRLKIKLICKKTINNLIKLKLENGKQCKVKNGVIE